MKFIPKPLVETADISRGQRTFKSSLKTIISGVIVLAGLYLVLGLLAEIVARTIPDRWERSFSGATALVSHSSSNELERAQLILDRLTEGESLRDLNYTLFIIEMNEPNAVAVPGGGIGLTPELLQNVESEAGLAFVLAHELGHHQYRHILRSVGRSLIFGIAGALLFNYDGLSSLDSAVRLAETGHSRKQERAADEFALRLLHKKYGDTTGALEFFELIQKNRDEHFWQKYAGSHPLTVDRLSELKLLQEQLKKAQPAR